MGRSGLECGNLTAARASLEGAIVKEKNFLKGTDVDQLTDVRRDMLKDQEFLIVVYDKVHESGLARQVCSEAPPDWTSCACTSAGSDVACVSK
jgi:hypothetical protein